MRHSQSFDKIDTFLKPLLNILILCNLIAGWGEGVIKEGAGILHQIYIFRVDVYKLGRVWFLKTNVGII